MQAGAVFLDRDGTINVDTGYVSSPGDVRLLPGAGEAVARLNRAGRRVIVVSNQSGLARGMFDERTLEKIHDRLRELLAAEGARLDAIYVCPHLAEGAAAARYGIDCDCRKPADGLLRRAAEQWGVDLAASWMVGDSERDVEAGRRAGCRTIRLGERSSESSALTAIDLSQVADIILGDSPR